MSKVLSKYAYSRCQATLAFIEKCVFNSVLVSTHFTAKLCGSLDAECYSTLTC